MTIISLRIDNQHREVVDNFCLLGSTINCKIRTSQEICHKLASGRAAIKALEKILRYCDTSIPTKIRLVKAMVFPVMFRGRRSWTLKKQDRKHIKTS